MWRRTLSILAIVVMSLLVGFLVYRFHFVEDNERNGVVSKYLMCAKKGVKDYVLLEDERYDSVNYEARALFVNDNIYDINFVASQYFSNEQSTRVFTDELQAQYNIYTGKNDIARRDIATTFTNIDNIGKMVLDIKGNALNEKIAPLVMLDSVDKNTMLGDMQNQYEGKGFSCSISEEDMVLSD